MLKNGSKQLLESKQAWERLCDESQTLLKKTNHMLNQEKAAADFYEKIFTELRDEMVNHLHQNP